MKKLIIYIICILSAVGLFFTAHVKASSSKLIMENVILKSNVITAYFDIVDSNGKSSGRDINKDNITASIGNNMLNLKKVSTFKSVNNGVTCVLMADISKSIDAKSQDNIKHVFNEIVNKAGSNDKIAIVTFGTKETVIQSFTSDKNILINKINSIKVNDDNTDLYRAVSNGLDMLADRQVLTDKKYIVIMSDGEESNDEGITKDEVLMKITQSHIPIFSIGLKNSDNQNTVEKMKVLGSFARLTNGENFVLGDGRGTITDIILAIEERINKSFVAQFDSSAVKLDGQTSSFNLSIKLDDKTTVTANQNIELKVTADNTSNSNNKKSDSKNSTVGSNTGDTSDDFDSDDSDVLPSSTSDTTPFYENPYYIAGAVAGLIIVGTVVVFLVIRSKNKIRNLKLAQKSVVSEKETYSSIEKQKLQIKNTKTVAIDTHQNQSNPNLSIDYVPQKSENHVDKGVKIRLIKLGRNNNEPVYEVILENTLIIGRDQAKSKLVFKNDELLSGKHCELILQDNKIFITDLGSTNGTYVNGIPISGAYRLKNDDILLIGSMELRISIIK